MTTADNITDEQIQALKDEADAVCDWPMSMACEDALEGKEKARALCARAINDAEAQS